MIRVAALCLATLAGGMHAGAAQAAASTAAVGVSVTVIAACTAPSVAMLGRAGADAGAASQDCSPYSVTLRPLGDAQPAQSSTSEAALLVSY